MSYYGHGADFSSFGDDEAPGDDRAMDTARTFTADTSSLELQESMYGAGAQAPGPQPGPNQQPQQWYSPAPQGGAGYTSSPPLVATTYPSTTSGSSLWSGLTGGITGFFNPNPNAPKVLPHTAPSPMIWVAVALGGVAVLALVLASSKRTSMGRHRNRRKHR